MPRKKSSNPSASGRSEQSKLQQNNRTRSWTCIVYPESAPEQWREIIDEEHIQWIESPLHNKDLNADNTPKKEHWHILLMFESVKDFEQVKEITDKLNAPIPQKCNGAKGLVRYMAHLDNPEKVQYDKNLIIAHGGADLDALFAPTASQQDEYLHEMRLYIKANNILEFEDIYDYADEERHMDWWPLLNHKCSNIIKTYLSSRRHRRQPKGNAEYGVFNKKTGEVIE